MLALWAEGGGKGRGKGVGMGSTSHMAGGGGGGGRSFFSPCTKRLRRINRGRCCLYEKKKGWFVERYTFYKFLMDLGGGGGE